MGNYGKKAPEKPKKKKVYKFRINIEEQYRDFPNQTDARIFLREILTVPIFFCSMEKVEVEEDDGK